MKVIARQANWHNLNSDVFQIFPISEEEETEWLMNYVSIIDKNSRHNSLDAYTVKIHGLWTLEETEKLLKCLEKAKELIGYLGS